MRPVTKAKTIAHLMRACDLLGIPHVYDEHGEYLPREERANKAVALDFGGGASSNVRGVCVYALRREGGGHVGAPDPFFRLLDQRKPHRDAAMILEAIVETLETVVGES